MGEFPFSAALDIWARTVIDWSAACFRHWTVCSQWKDKLQAHSCWTTHQEGKTSIYKKDPLNTVQILFQNTCILNSIPNLLIFNAVLHLNYIQTNLIQKQVLFSSSKNLTPHLFLKIHNLIIFNFNGVIYLSDKCTNQTSLKCICFHN